jgi:hypothetical protein
LKIDEKHIKEILCRNFGEAEGKVILDRWANGKHQNNFRFSLDEFNNRRKDAFNGKYETFLSQNYDTAYSAYFNEVNKITLTKILATQSNVDFLNTIYQGRYTFALRPIPTRIHI